MRIFAREDHEYVLAPFEPGEVEQVSDFIKSLHENAHLYFNGRTTSEDGRPGILLRAGTLCLKIVPSDRKIDDEHIELLRKDCLQNGYLRFFGSFVDNHELAISVGI